MATKDVDATLYEHFDPQERLTLLLEALARDDEEEADLLRESCPRKVYSQIDDAFQSRITVAFDIMAVVCIDLKYMLGKLQVLHCAMETVVQFGTMNHITAQLAFIEGEHCSTRRPQLEYFKKELKPLSIDDEDEEDDQQEEEEPDHIDDLDEQDDIDFERPPTKKQLERGRRMAAVERRAEFATDCVLVTLAHAAQGIAGDLVNSWTAFGQFCRKCVGVEPETLMKAWRLPIVAEIEETLKRHEDVKADEAKVEEYGGYICMNWDRRFEDQ